MTESWYCPNEKDGDALMGEHQFFTRRHRQIVSKTYLGNGKQWAFDAPTVLADDPMGAPICATCKTVAVVDGLPQSS